MINNLFTFLERIKINFTWWLNPLIEIMRRKLIFFFHKNVLNFIPFFLKFQIFVMKIILDKFTIIAFANHNHPSLLFALVPLMPIDLNVIKGRVSKDWEFFTEPFPIPLIFPWMFRTMAFEIALKPWVYWSVVMLHIVVKSWFEFIWREYLDCPFLPTGTQRFALPHVYLDMHHPMGKRFQFSIPICGTVKD